VGNVRCEWVIYIKGTLEYMRPGERKEKGLEMKGSGKEVGGADFWS